MRTCRTGNKWLINTSSVHYSAICIKKRLVQDMAYVAVIIENNYSTPSCEMTYEVAIVSVVYGTFPIIAPPT